MGPHSCVPVLLLINFMTIMRQVQKWSNAECCGSECHIAMSNEMRSGQHTVCKKTGITVGVGYEALAMN